jgi:hypothetical protein
MQKPAIKFIALLIFIFSVYSSQAQYQSSFAGKKVINSDSLVTSKIADLQSFWKKYNELSIVRLEHDNFAVLPEVFKAKRNDSVSNDENDYIRKANLALIESLKTKTGLEGVAGYQENFGIYVDSPEEDINYHRKAYAGIDWNILGNGFLDNKYKREIVANENTILALTPKSKIVAADYMQISHKIIYDFNVHKIKLIETRKQILNDKIAIAEELYLLKNLSRVDLITLLQQQVDIESMNQIYKSYNQQLKAQLGQDSITGKVLPLFDIDVAKTLGVAEAPVYDSILKLQKENLELKYKPINQLRLKTELHYNYYHTVAQLYPDRNFVSAAVVFAMPIPMGTKANKDLINTQARLMEFKFKESQKTEQADMLNMFYEFRYKLKQYNNFYEKRKKYEELIRVERVKEKFGDLEFNPLTALNLLDELITVDIEMLDLQQKMYLNLLEINSKLPGSDVSNITKPYSVDSVAMNKDNISRGIYIWSDAQKKYAPLYMTEYLHFNKITKAFISIRKDKDNFKEAKELINTFSTNGIRSEILIGNNKLLSDDDANQFYDMLTKDLDMKSVAAFHLDVEPQTMDDWTQNKDKYLKKYVELVTTTKEYCAKHSIQLSVSIPLYFPDSVLAKIYPNADNVYLMAYEDTDIDFITTKVKEEFALDAGKTYISLRAKDFPNRIECEKLIRELSQTLNTTRFAYHDFETFIRLDDLSIIKDQK